MSVTTKGIASAAAVATALALGLVAHVSTPRATPAADAVAAHASSVKAAEAKAALLTYLKNSKPTALQIHRAGLHPGQTMTRLSTTQTTLSTANWSGYASSSSTHQEYTSVGGSWKVPTLTCTAEQRLASQWVGLDGVTSSTVEQTGILEYCFEGTAFYYTWWEMAPAASNLVGNGTTLKPGDSIVAKVTRSGTNYTMTLIDSTTTGNNISKTQSCAAATCLANSAEWIDERPASAIGIVPLANTSNWSPFGASTTAGGVTDTIASAPNSAQVLMLDVTGTYDLTSVSALTSTGKGFTTKWLNSY